MSRHQSGNRQAIKWDAKGVLERHADLVHAASKAGDCILGIATSMLHTPLLNVTGHAMLNVAPIFLNIMQTGLHTDSMHSCQTALAASLTWHGI